MSHASWHISRSHNFTSSPSPLVNLLATRKSIASYLPLCRSYLPLHQREDAGCKAQPGSYTPNMDMPLIGSAHTSDLPWGLVTFVQSYEKDPDKKSSPQEVLFGVWISRLLSLFIYMRRAGFCVPGGIMSLTPCPFKNEFRYTTQHSLHSARKIPSPSSLL